MSYEIPIDGVLTSYSRIRSVPFFGDDIRAIYGNASEMKQLTAYTYEDLLLVR